MNPLLGMTPEEVRAVRRIGEQMIAARRQFAWLVPIIEEARRQCKAPSFVPVEWTQEERSDD